MAKKDGKALRLFERICVQLIFLLSAFLILFLGIRRQAAPSTLLSPSGLRSSTIWWRA